MKGILAVVGIVVALILVFGGSYVSAVNSGARYDAQLKAQYDNMQNVLGQYSLKVTEAAQVPAMYRDALSKVARDAIEGRYGPNGSQATFQWIQEQNPNVDPSVFLKIQQIIDGGRDNFKVEQTAFLDMKRSYEADLNSFWSGFWLRLAGYPKVPLDKYKLISSEAARAAFETGVDQPIKLQ